MGLFSKRDASTKPIKVIYYEGGLPGFGTNLPCQIILENKIVQITKINPEVTIKLDVDRIQGIDIYFKEEEYMLKHHGHAASTSKSKGIDKIYFAINYAQDDKIAEFGFWCTAMEIGAIRKLSESVLKGRAPVEISL